MYSFGPIASKSTHEETTSPHTLVLPLTRAGIRSTARAQVNAVAGSARDVKALNTRQTPHRDPYLPNTRTRTRTRTRTHNISSFGIQRRVSTVFGRGNPSLSQRVIPDFHLAGTANTRRHGGDGMQQTHSNIPSAARSRKPSGASEPHSHSDAAHPMNVKQASRHSVAIS